MTATILEVHVLLREALTRVIGAAGIEVLGSHSEQSGFLRSLAARPPSVAVVGVLLPETARNVLEEARQLHPTLPVVVIASAADRAKVVECQQLGAAAYLDRFNVGCDLMLEILRELAAGTPPTPKVRSPQGVATLEQSAAIGHLSKREVEVLGHLAVGMDNLKIAASLGIAEHTVKVHVSHLYRKLKMENRTQMALLARDLGIPLHQE